MYPHPTLLVLLLCVLVCASAATEAYTLEGSQGVSASQCSGGDAGEQETLFGVAGETLTLYVTLCPAPLVSTEPPPTCALPTESTLVEYVLLSIQYYPYPTAPLEWEGEGQTPSVYVSAYDPVVLYASESHPGSGVYTCPYTPTEEGLYVIEATVSLSPSSSLSEAPTPASLSDVSTSASLYIGTLSHTNEVTGVREVVSVPYTSAAVEYAFREREAERDPLWVWEGEDLVYNLHLLRPDNSVVDTPLPISASLSCTDGFGSTHVSETAPTPLSPAVYMGYCGAGVYVMVMSLPEDWEETPPVCTLSISLEGVDLAAVEISTGVEPTYVSGVTGLSLPPTLETCSPVSLVLQVTGSDASPIHSDMTPYLTLAWDTETYAYSDSSTTIVHLPDTVEYAVETIAPSAPGLHTLSLYISDGVVDKGESGGEESSLRVLGSDTVSVYQTIDPSLSGLSVPPLLRPEDTVVVDLHLVDGCGLPLPSSSLSVGDALVTDTDTGEVTATVPLFEVLPLLLSEVGEEDDTASNGYYTGALTLPEGYYTLTVAVDHVYDDDGVDILRDTHTFTAFVTISSLAVEVGSGYVDVSTVLSTISGVPTVLGVESDIVVSLIETGGMVVPVDVYPTLQWCQAGADTYTVSCSNIPLFWNPVSHSYHTDTLFMCEYVTGPSVTVVEGVFEVYLQGEPVTDCAVYLERLLSYSLSTLYSTPYIVQGKTATIQAEIVDTCGYAYTGCQARLSVFSERWGERERGLVTLAAPLHEMDVGVYVSQLSLEEEGEYTCVASVTCAGDSTLHTMSSTTYAAASRVVVGDESYYVSSLFSTNSFPEYGSLHTPLTGSVCLYDMLGESVEEDLSPYMDISLLGVTDPVSGMVSWVSGTECYSVTIDPHTDTPTPSDLLVDVSLSHSPLLSTTVRVLPLTEYITGSTGIIFSTSTVETCQHMSITLQLLDVYGAVSAVDVSQYLGVRWGGDMEATVPLSVSWDSDEYTYTIHVDGHSETGRALLCIVVSDGGMSAVVGTADVTVYSTLHEDLSWSSVPAVAPMGVTTQIAFQPRDGCSSVITDLVAHSSLYDSTGAELKGDVFGCEDGIFTSEIQLPETYDPASYTLTVTFTRETSESVYGSKESELSLIEVQGQWEYTIWTEIVSGLRAFERQYPAIYSLAVKVEEVAEIELLTPEEYQDPSVSLSRRDLSWIVTALKSDLPLTKGSEKYNGASVVVPRLEVVDYGSLPLPLSPKKNPSGDDYDTVHDLWTCNIDARTVASLYAESVLFRCNNEGWRLSMLETSLLRQWFGLEEAGFVPPQPF
ncbi:hypothetical protein KIPB_007424 [Kipferlia bialata]|uniref:Ig-like domain-containing protein n=1 Tax=Kipferlia bialata TaxID=797122 RepID=A0A9K3GKK6_9EUKA|nr:hypothetical protein KIPB_007424 [Kipferlia bialata]|eukprot:g7424.t1